MTSSYACTENLPSARREYVGGIGILAYLLVGRES
jgi:hypothetical protein